MSQGLGTLGTDEASHWGRKRLECVESCLVAGAPTAEGGNKQDGGRGGEGERREGGREGGESEGREKERINPYYIMIRAHKPSR